MSETKWTKGPWTRGRNLDFQIFGDGLRPVAEVCTPDYDKVGLIESQANAALIAAATDLYEALDAILPYIPISSVKDGGASRFAGNVIAADKVRAALSRARGEKEVG